MTTTRRFVGDDLFRFSTTNMDPLTETYSTSFYLSYLTRWPGMNQCQEGVSGRISSYMIEFRRLGLGKTLMAELERVSDKDYNGYFVDLFVRVGNTIAVRMYKALGYMVYRRVLGYYGEPAEDAFDMRKRCPRDVEGLSEIPLPAPTEGV